MENKIVTMTSNQFGTVRKICENNNVLFCASDVAKALGYSKPNKAINDHCRAITKRSTLISGKMQHINYIAESDVYRLICHSKLPTAMEFEKWVFEDVVPKAVNDNLSAATPTTSKQPTLETSEYHYFDKTFRGQPVLSTKDIAYFTGVSIGTVNWQLRTDFFVEGTDYYRLEKSVLREFKNENPSVSKATTSPFHVITKSGFIKLMKMFKCEKTPPEYFTEKNNSSTLSTTLPKPNLVNTNECIVALNVLRWLTESAKEWKAESERRKDNRMAESYKKDLDAYAETTKRIGMLISAGY